MSNKVSVTSEVMDERTRQDQKWGGGKHDDQHGPDKWCEFIERRAQHAYRLAEWTDNAAERARRAAIYRQLMIEIAALAVAAVESLDRSLKTLEETP